MKDLMEYKGYYGSYQLSEEDKVFYGKLEFIKDLISYEGSSARQIVSAFHHAVDDYLVLCKQEGKEPERPFKGSFNIRIGQELHRRIALKAMRQGESINSFIKNVLKSA